jgi:2',3'-cyclic-nucleotide 2'-phosphodiesterase (5'-nucleotidase family)
MNLKSLSFCIILSITAFGYAQNVSKPKYQYQYEMIRLDSTYDAKIDPKLAKYVEKKRRHMEKQMQVVVAHTDTELESYAPESPLSNFLTDLLLEESAKYIKDTTFDNLDLSMLNFGGIREPIPAGPITIGKIFSVLPFDNNNMVVVDVKGSELRKMFFNNLRELKTAQSFSAGVRLVYKGGILDSVTINGKPLDDSRTYRMATSNFVENGGDKILADVKTQNIFTQPQPFRTTIIEFFKAKGKFRGIKDGRVTIIK